MLSDEPAAQFEALQALPAWKSMFNVPQSPRILPSADPGPLKFVRRKVRANCTCNLLQCLLTSFVVQLQIVNSEQLAETIRENSTSLPAYDLLIAFLQ
jgi:hypothetical protein